MVSSFAKPRFVLPCGIAVSLSISTCLLLLLVDQNQMIAAARPNTPLRGVAGTLIAVNQGDRDISLIDTGRGEEIARVPEGALTGHEVATSADGNLAFIPIYGDSVPGKAGTDGDQIVVVDLRLRRVVHRIRFGHGVRPHAIVMNQRDHLLYVTTELDRTVTIVSPQSFRILGTIPTGRSESHMLAISHDGRFGYTANISSGSVSVLDLRSRKLIAVIPVANEVQRISVSIDGGMVFTADQKLPRLAVIDPADKRVRQWVGLPAIGYGSASTFDGRWLIVTLPTASALAVVDIKTLQLAKIIPVPQGPHEVLMTPDNQTAYVACTVSQMVAKLDLRSFTVMSTVKVGRVADGIGWTSKDVSAEGDPDHP